MESKFKVGMIAWSPFEGFQILKGSGVETLSLMQDRNTFCPDGRYRSVDKHASLLTVEEAEKLGYKMTRADKSRLGLLKRRVVTIEKWTNAYKDGKKSLIYDTYEEARNNAISSKNYLFPVKITGTYEIEVES